ncbi:MAG: class I tRNA ligase family protein, partial [Candidatus Peregrinibacteria bacterium]|nr:class I tRNA ligase family protein [Candidatus Peregrinibacteria bacterium]
IELIDPVDAEAKFTEPVNDFSGQLVHDANPGIIKKLKEENKIVKHETINHSYPHCWRCDTALIYRPISTWFVKVESLKERLLKTNQEVSWVPEHIKDGRFGKWLEGARDWAISRNRYWGAPIPVWRCENEHLKVIGSIEQLEKLSGEKVEDLHKHKIDHLTLACEECDQKMHRIPEVLDCWFESGSMPYAQLHYPFENKEKFENNFPAEFIAEGLDQTRGWFYTLHVLSNSLFEKHAFKNCIVNGIVLAEDGQKMSKRLKNYPDPNHILNDYGADALRFYLMNSPVVKADDLRFSEKGVSDVVRNFILPIWNAYSFFVTYANIDEWKANRSPLTANRSNKLDQWILEELNKLIVQETEYMNAYDLHKASNAIYEFVDNLTNWYIRRSRRRFWKSEDDTDKDSAYQTLYTVLTTLSQVIAPFMPFVSEEIYRNLTSEESVHLTDYPTPGSDKADEKLMQEMFVAKTIVSLGLAGRAKKKIKVRQPLSRVQIALAEQYDKSLLEDQMETIMEELNVKAVEIIENASDLATVIAKPNAKLLGPKYGKEVQTIINEAKQGNFERLENGNISVLSYELAPEELEIAYMGSGGSDIETQAGILVALDMSITPELEMEGRARDIVRQIQELRKAADYKVDDRITIALIGVDSALLSAFGDYIKAETLATEIVEEMENGDQFTEFEGITIKVKR